MDGNNLLNNPNSSSFPRLPHEPAQLPSIEPLKEETETKKIKQATKKAINFEKTSTSKGKSKFKISASTTAQEKDSVVNVAHRSFPTRSRSLNEIFSSLMSKRDTKTPAANVAWSIILGPAALFSRIFCPGQVYDPLKLKPIADPYNRNAIEYAMKEMIDLVEGDKSGTLTGDDAKLLESLK